MNGSARNEARELASQLIGVIRRGDMSLSKLRELLDMGNTQLARYEKALNFIEQIKPENWTYDQADEALRIGSGRTDDLVSRLQWDHMLRDHQLQLRADYVAIFKEGQVAFTEVKQELLSEISKNKQEKTKRRDEEVRYRSEEQKENEEYLQTQASLKKKQAIRSKMNLFYKLYRISGGFFSFLGIIFIIFFIMACIEKPADFKAVVAIGVFSALFILPGILLFKKAKNLKADWVKINEEQKPVVTKAAVEEHTKKAEPLTPKPAPEIEEQYVNDCLRQKYEELPETRSWNSDPAFRKVLDPLNSGDNSGACREAESLIAQFRDFANLYAWWGAALLGMGSLDKAREVLKDGLENVKEKYPLCNRLGEVAWKARDLKTAVYWWAQGLQCQESLNASNYGGSEGAYLYLHYVSEGLGLAECSRAFLMRVDSIRPGMIRLNAETASDLISLARSGGASIKRVLEELVASYIVPRKKTLTKVDPDELRKLIRQLDEVASYSRDSDAEKDVAAIERLAELGDPQALDVLTKVERHFLIDIKFAARESIDKIKNANR